jgi:hypothetical protein
MSRYPLVKLRGAGVPGMPLVGTERYERAMVTPIRDATLRCRRGPLMDMLILGLH